MDHAPGHAALAIGAQPLARVGQAHGSTAQLEDALGRQEANHAEERVGLCTHLGSQVDIVHRTILEHICYPQLCHDIERSWSHVTGAVMQEEQCTRVGGQSAGAEELPDSSCDRENGPRRYARKAFAITGPSEIEKYIPNKCNNDTQSVHKL